MFVNMDYNTEILTLQPVVLYSLLAIPQPGVAQELPSASLSLSYRFYVWNERRVRSPDPTKFEVVLLKLLKRD